MSPLADHANDGHSLSPYEALFVPLGRWDDAGQPYGSPAELAAAYSEWMAVRRSEEGRGGEEEGRGGEELSRVSLRRFVPSKSWLHVRLHVHPF